MTTWSPFKSQLCSGLLYGTGSAQLTLLSVILHHHSMTPVAIAAIASTMTVASMVGAIASGPLATHWGAVRAMQIGVAASLSGVAMLPLTLDSVVLTATS